MGQSGIEKRKFKRTVLPCPIEISDEQGNLLAKTQTVNISDGGALIQLPLEALPTFNSEVNLNFSVPRSTPNTYMLEECNCGGRVVRHQPMLEESEVCIAVEFSKPLDLVLEG